MGLGEVLPEPLEARAWRGGGRSNFSQCVEGQSLCPWERGSLEETRLFACADLENGEEMVSVSASGDELQSVMNGAKWVHFPFLASGDARAHATL